MKTTLGRIAAITAISTAAMTSMAVAEETYTDLRFSVGGDYSSGKYGGTQNTNIAYVPLGVKYEYGNLSLTATVPWLSISGPGSVAGGPDDPVVIGDEGVRTTESGLGDVSLGAAYTIEPLTDSMPFFEVSGKVKLPTANETKGLGTGKADYALQLDAFKSYGNITPFATIGHRWRGSSALITLKNSIYASAGVSYKLDDTKSAGLSIDYQSKSTATSKSRLEAVPFVSFKTSDKTKIMAYGSAGFTDSVPAVGIGLQVSYSPWH